MESLLERLKPGARITVIRLRSLGDCVLTTPALELLKSYRPDLQLTVVVEPRFRAVFEGNPDVDALIAPSLVEMHRSRPQLALNLHGGTTSTKLMLVAAAPLRAGFGHYRGQAIYNVRIPRAQEILGEERTVHTAEHLASAMFHLGVPRREIPRARLFGPRGTRKGRYAILHPFASEAAKAWPAERFAKVAGRLREEGIEPLVLCGPNEPAGLVAGVEALAGQSLGEAIATIRSASLFLGNDSGPAHIAAACGVPAVVLFGASDPVIWAPWKAPEAVQIARSRMDEITVEEVVAAMDSLEVRR